MKCLEHFKDSDQIVITGDIYDFLTSETVAQVNKHIFNAYDNIMACLGNHEVVKAMGEEKAEGWTGTVAERMETIGNAWSNDVYYSSNVLGEKVMLIQMDNGTTGEFWDSQVELFKADLQRARENGYSVLLFYHIPIATGNAEYRSVTTTDKGDAETVNFYSDSSLVSGKSEGASGEIYDLIVNNGDIIKGCFAGHLHSDFYIEIDAMAADGTYTAIPQYVLKGTIYDEGNALRITVK